MTERVRTKADSGGPGVTKAQLENQVRDEDGVEEEERTVHCRCRRKKRKEFSETPQRILQAALRLIFSIILPFMLSFIARSKTSLTPCPVFAEHSTYFAPMFLATSIPCCAVTGCAPWAARRSCVRLSFRRSVFVATRMRGTDGQKCDTSGCH